MGQDDIIKYTVNGTQKGLRTQFGDIDMTELNCQWQTTSRLTNAVFLTTKQK